MRYATMTLMLGVAFARLLNAQESTARLLGTVTDPTGAVIPAASVVARNVATGLERNTVANESGNYSIPSLPIGQYTLVAESAGFRSPDHRLNTRCQSSGDGCGTCAIISDAHAGNEDRTYCD